MTDPAAGVGVLAALAAGAVSFLSPCVLPLVPAYLSAVVGVAPADLEHAGARRVLPPSLAFVASFSLIFILLGLGATTVGSALRDHHDTLDKVAAAVIVAMGVYFVASAFVARLNRTWHVERLLTRAGKGGPVVAGAAFAIAWTPCGRTDARPDPQRRRAHRVRRARRRSAGVLLGRTGDPVSGDRTGVRADDVGV